MLAPTPLMDESTTNGSVSVPPVAEPEPPKVEAPAPPDDPFAAAGLLDGFGDSSLPTLSTTEALDSAKFEYSRSPIAPLTITTPQFGERWGSCPSTQSVTIASSTNVNTLSKFVSLCVRAGLHKVEEIAATNEGIAACMAGGGSSIALVHGKVSPLSGDASRLDITVKSTDANLGSQLAMYMQNMCR